MKKPSTKTETWLRANGFKPVSKRWRGSERKFFYRPYFHKTILYRIEVSVAAGLERIYFFKFVRSELIDTTK